MNNQNLIIDDNYIADMISYMNQQGTRCEEMLQKYILLMEKAIMEGIQDGQIQQALIQYLDMVKEIKGSFGKLCSQTANIVSQYLTKIDETDMDIY